MKIFVNGKDEVAEDGTTVADLIAVKGFNPKTIIIEYNYELVPSESWNGILLKEDDRLEILRFVGGG
ncbi:MAG: sulfur carrier protein ThiS [Deltaproteobacteria bacterium]|nr:sulfur carrier protein ThiS [Deltaproteobacteria bacterium]